MNQDQLIALANEHGAGFQYVFTEDDGAHFFQRENPETRTLITPGVYKTKPRTYSLMRLLDSDLPPKNFALMVKLGLTNTNKAPR
jgi:hypothetical protein